MRRLPTREPGYQCCQLFLASWAGQELVGGHVLVVSFLITISAMAASSRKKLGVFIFLFSRRTRILTKQMFSYSLLSFCTFTQLVRSSKSQPEGGWNRTQQAWFYSFIYRTTCKGFVVSLLVPLSPFSSWHCICRQQFSFCYVIFYVNIVDI